LELFRLAFRFTGSVPEDAVDPRRLASPLEATKPAMMSSMSVSAQSMASIFWFIVLESKPAGTAIAFSLEDDADDDGFMVEFETGD
jgi:hypothetical protein